MSAKQNVGAVTVAFGNAARRLSEQPAALWFAAWIIGIFVLLGVSGPYITPHSAYEIDTANKLRPPVGWEGSTWTRPFGTDHLGRDMLSRVVHGTRITFLVALLVIGFSGSVGLGIGIMSGYYGGRVDAILSRVIDSTLALPTILMALLFAVTIGPGLFTVVLAIGLVHWARFARVIRGQVLAVKEQDFIALARVAGCSPLYIMVRHILPNVTNTFVVLISLNVGSVILLEATLSFLGAGIPPPEPSWGNIVADGRLYMFTAWWISTIAGLTIVILVVAFNFLGDWLRDALDPTLRQV